MTTNINNSPEYACRTCAKQECGCKDTECQLPCHFYTEQAEQEPVAYFLDVKAGFSSKPLYEQVSDEYKNDADVFPLYAAPQPVMQEPVAYFLDVKAGFSSKPLYEQVSDEYKNDADVFPLYAAPQPVMQEPVAWAHPSGGYLSARYMKEFATGLEKETYTIPLYAAPV